MFLTKPDVILDFLKNLEKLRNDKNLQDHIFIGNYRNVTGCHIFTMRKQREYSFCQRYSTNDK